MGSRAFIDRVGAEMVALQLAARPGRNALCSPVGVAALLSLLCPASVTELTSVTQSALRRFEPEPAALRDFDPGNPPTAPLLHLASHLLLIAGAQPRPTYLAEVTGRAEISRVALGDATSRLNAWAALHTGGLFPQTAVGVDEQTRLVLQNALLFAARWERELTLVSCGAAFRRADGTTSTADYLGTVAQLQLVRGDGWRAVRLPYRGEGLVCDFILPRRRCSLTELPATTWAEATAALSGAAPTLVQLRVPKLDLVSGPLELAPLLDRLGLSLQLDRILPGLSGWQAAQQVRVAVSETGTVAAALTEQWMCSAVAEDEPVEFTVNHPFVLRVVDLAAEVPLIEAAVVDPAC
ncbi:serpin family protein [Buchananella hordeovulneris]|uniref:serpin family protein n=1 Tax=Buchananella hordeovulneris TaxID=52770 RepID=UPI0026DB2188|nr:serpin family protein [Buchananella hordeovulneris]MDO5081097.1 serpin family protein [Buchananella hordeovulneris]